MNAPVFVVCCARSGSTLLTRLLGMHREIAVPPETNLASAWAGLLSAGETLADDLLADGRSLRPGATARVRQVARSVVEGYLAQAGKSILCDKSLTNEMHAELLADLFPAARFICLYRHCLDVADSMIEASPWGFDAYGVAPYIARWPVSFAAGIADMWLTVTGRQLDFASAHPDRTLTLRYEELAASPRQAMRNVFAGLGLQAPAVFTDGDDSRPLGLAPRRAPRGAGDHKIAFTGSVATASVGRGRRVPVALLPDALREAVNARLAELGYSPVGEDWNRTVVSQAGPSADGSPAALAAITEVLQRRLAGWQGTADGQARVAVEDLGCTVTVNVAQRTVDVEPGVAGALYAASAQSLLAVLLGGMNLGSALRSGGVRLCQPDQAQSLVAESLLDLLAFPQAVSGTGAAGTGAAGTGGTPGTRPW